MQAVIETGGKQFRVQAGDIIQIEKLEGETGSKVKFDKVLFALKSAQDSSQIWMGKPYLNGASVDGEVVGQGRGKKILIIKMKRRKQYRRTQGHRQSLTQVLVTSVDNGTGEKLSLSAQEREAKLKKFQCHLKPKGLAFSPKKVKDRTQVKKATKAVAPAKKTAAKAKKTK